MLVQTNQNELCRRPLLAKISDDAKCPMPSTMDICRAAIKVEKMNPPKKKVRPSVSHASVKCPGVFQMSRRLSDVQASFRCPGVFQMSRRLSDVQASFRCPGVFFILDNIPYGKTHIQISQYTGFGSRS